MKSVNITLRVDDELKHEAESLFNDLGLNMTTAFNIFLRQSVREQQIPFSITKRTLSKKTLAAMKDAKEGKDLFGPYDNIEDLMKDLNA